MTITIMNLSLNLFVAMSVFVATVITDAVYVQFTAAVASRQRLRAANWSSIWYLLSAFAVISYTGNPAYVVFAAIGSWVGAYLSLTWQPRQSGRAPAPGRAVSYAVDGFGKGGEPNSCKFMRLEAEITKGRELSATRGPNATETINGKGAQARSGLRWPKAALDGIHG